MTGSQRLTVKKMNCGFTLVELAMVLMIVGLLLGGLLPTISSQMEQQQTRETRKQLDEIQQALIGFALIKGRLPCPANGSTASGDESTTGSDSSLTCTLTKGALPWATLGVNETDGWGRRFTYRVSQGATSNFADGSDGTGASCNIATGVSFQLCSVANLNVLSTSGGSNVATNVPAIVVSHGKNGLGAYPAGGGAQIGTATGDEEENADDNNTFVSKNYSTDFDDLVIWLSPNILLNRMVTAGKLP
ncbi:MAG: prepilin-type N-terminal cleavage/methylation domain-containing protein [Gallionellales bacterium GWE2_58_10]|nr:MAG: prepilin-type N-terminal cleavage/methylation domain-containing protein [Gallionellales bacterium GWE2_58_10]HBA90776.1 prepilin-type cleavage/methylation domain-containing protein [Anaerolineaceae bacterium]